MNKKTFVKLSIYSVAITLLLLLVEWLLISFFVKDDPVTCFAIFASITAVVVGFTLGIRVRR